MCGGRIRLGQKRVHAGGDGAPAAGGAGGGRAHRLPWRRFACAVAPCPAPADRAGRGDGVPGTNLLAEPLLHGRLADRRGAALPRRSAAPAGAGAGAVAARLGRHPGAGAADARLPAPTVRRVEPAGHDRDGHRLQPGAAHRRRAHHGARRHGAEGRAGVARRLAARAWHGAGADHPRHGRCRRDGSARAGDVCGAGDGGAAGRAPCLPALATPTPPPCWTRCPSVPRASRACLPSPASCQASTTGPAACLFAPRCAYKTIRCNFERPALRSVMGARVRCHYPLDDTGRPTGHPS